MDFSGCYNCGQQGHFASSCPLGIDLDSRPASTNHPPRWKPADRLPPEEQAAINEWGMALCRDSLARRG